ncbi:MAG: fasciclin domain-containing protein [Chitinophagaceae bacterium]
MKTIKSLSLALIALFLFNGAFAQNMSGDMKPVTVGGAPMYASRNIVENAVNSKDHTTLVAAVKAAGLVETLQSAGPFTVFAPTNEAFDKLPKGTVGTLVKPENKAMLASILTYHVVVGKIDSNELMKRIKEGNGITELTTVAGGKLWVMMKGNKVQIKDEKGDISTISIQDVYQSNGVIHVVDTVLLPKA